VIKKKKEQYHKMDVEVDSSLIATDCFVKLAVL
jgi:hypothetical protein